MVSDTLKKQKDAELFEKALTDCLEKGSTDEICPYCKTKLYKDSDTNSFNIRCHTENCFSYAVRGI